MIKPGTPEYFEALRAFAVPLQDRMGLGYQEYKKFHKLESSDESKLDRRQGMYYSTMYNSNGIQQSTIKAGVAHPFTARMRGLNENGSDNRLLAEFLFEFNSESYAAEARLKNQDKYRRVNFVTQGQQEVYEFPFEDIRDVVAYHLSLSDTKPLEVWYYDKDEPEQVVYRKRTFGLGYFDRFNVFVA